MKFKGVVQKHSQRGHALGFPTANISFQSEESGIYVAEVAFDSKRYPAAAYADQGRGLLEAHLLDFSEDLYGEEIEIELIEKIRDAEKFTNEEALRAAIESDIAKVRAYFTLR